MKKNTIMKALLPVITLVFSTGVNSALITLDVTYSGHYGLGTSGGNTGYYTGSDGNIRLGEELVSGSIDMKWRNWLSFNLNAIPGEYTSLENFEIESATLEVTNDLQNNTVLEYVKWSDVSNDHIFDMITHTNNFQSTIYDDLGTGTTYALNQATAGPLHSFDFNGDATLSLNNTFNSSFQLWTIGGSLSDMFGETNDLGIAYAPTGAVQLILEVTDIPTVVPIPSAMWLFGSGLLTLLGIARRKA